MDSRYYCPGVRLVKLISAGVPSNWALRLASQVVLLQVSIALAQLNSTRNPAKTLDGGCRWELLARMVITHSYGH